jgi:anti-sigma factor RsiW
MTCRHVNALLADYCDGDLAPDVSFRFEVHLGRCVRCLAYLKGYRASMRLVRARSGLAAGVMPEELVQSILRSHRVLA